MAREVVGSIEPNNGSLTGKNEWISLIGKHSSLASVAPKSGINPFKKSSMVFNPSSDTATIVVGGAPVGAIHWAMDDSRQLIVWSDAEAIDRVTVVANDVAMKLGWRFVACVRS